MKEKQNQNEELPIGDVKFHDDELASALSEVDGALAHHEEKITRWLEDVKLVERKLQERCVNIRHEMVTGTKGRSLIWDGLKGRIYMQVGTAKSGRDLIEALSADDIELAAQSLPLLLRGIARKLSSDS